MDTIPQGAIPVDQFEGSSEQQPTQQASIPQDAIPVDQFQHADMPDGAIPVDQFESQDDKYGSGVEQVKAGLEGALRGAVSAPIASGIERMAGVDPEAIRGRQEANPWTAGLSEAAGFAGSAFIPVVGQAGLIGKVGNAGVHLAEMAGVSSKLAQGAVRLGTEMAVLGGLDETSKLILKDPDQTATTALQHIGLSAALGGLTGGALKGVNMLGKAALEKSGINSGFLKDVSEGLKARFSGIDKAELMAHELQDTSEKFAAMGDELHGPSGLKDTVIKQAMPEMTEENASKIHQQVVDISDKLSSTIESAKENPYLKGSIPKLEFHQKELLAAVQNPEATFADKFKALNTLKQDMQGLARYGSTAEDTALGKVAKNMAATIRESLEDNKVWGGAADIQKDINAAWTKALDKGVKQGQNKFFTNGIVDPGKVSSYLKQAEKATSPTVRQQMLGPYIEAMDNFQNTVSKIYEKAGIENPHEPISMNALKESLNKPTMGDRVAAALHDKVISQTGGALLGATAGGYAGHASGIPFAGYAGELIGGHIGQRVLPSILQPLVESPVSMKAFTAAHSMINNIVNGEKQMTNAASGVFGNMAKTIPQNIPFKDTKKLDEQLKKLQDDPKKALGAAIDESSYLPKHSQSFNTTTAAAASWLNSQRPTSIKQNPLDTPIEPTPAQEYAFHRKLEIAQNPLIIMHNVKDGSLQASDIATLNALYPKMVPNIVQKTSEAMMKHLQDGGTIPYSTRLGLSILMGQPMDSSMTPASIQAAQPKPAPQQNQQTGQLKGRKGGTALGKSNNSYQTASQAAESDRGNRS